MSWVDPRKLIGHSPATLTPIVESKTQIEVSIPGLKTPLVARMTHSLESNVEYVESLAKVNLPDDAVVIADRNLPNWLFGHFEDPILVTGGESLKTLGAIEALALEILERRSTRPLTIVAVGGGSVGDAVGFLASTLWRGVNLWHIPTTLLAMVDSAHGGKTAMNLGEYKNQLGTFYAAQNIVISQEILSALPQEQREEGLAEMLKAMWLDGPESLAQWRSLGTETLASAPFEEIAADFLNLLKTAISLKHRVVKRDPFETKSIRTLLNLGHTMAHALELSAGLSHGHAVAWGLAVAVEMSHGHHGLVREQAEELLKDVYPLLVPFHEALIPEHEELISLLRRDKKRKDGVLKGVFLSAPGVGFVESSRAEDWIESFKRVYEWTHSPALLEFHPERAPSSPVEIKPPSSKSVLNRLLILADLNPRVEVTQISGATDVVLMKRGLSSLKSGRMVEVGDGGTTFRFLAVRAAAMPGRHRFHLGQRLAERPHDDLFRALRSAGAKVETKGREVMVEGWPEFPTQISVSAKHSSQYASAFALLAGGGHEFVLTIEDELVSESYFELTLELLEEIGTLYKREGNRLHFSGLNPDTHTVSASMDESSAATWRALSWLGLPAICNAVEDRSQPDHVLEEYLDSTLHEVDIRNSPDLMPVLATAYVVAGQKVKVHGGPTLKLKESDRLEGLKDLLVRLGSETRVEGESLVTAPAPKHSSLVDWETNHDHRMAFAAAVAALCGPIRIHGPHVVEKSYPRFWQDLRRLGFKLQPATFPLDG